MSADAKPIPFDEFAQHLDTIFDESEAHGSTSILVERHGTVFAVRAARRSKRQRASKPRGLTPHDPLLGIIGIWQSAEPTDIGRYKHEYLAEAAANLHETPPATPTASTRGSASAESGEQQTQEGNPHGQSNPS